MAKRNDPCHCGSNLKYKHCCLAKDQEEELATAHMSPVEQELWAETKHKIPTWLIFVVSTILFAAIAGVLYYLGYMRAAGAVFGCGLLVMVMFSVFRSAPPSRINPGDGGNINFGSQ
ncbi:MAG: SEC-C domain-containing protein [Bradymonadales bacterium]|jgi:hypothetical protein